MAASIDGLHNDFSLMSFGEFEKSTGGEILFDFSDKQAFFSVAVDSRNASKDGLFIPLRGEKQDGHIYIEAALKNGAVCFTADDAYVSDAGNLSLVETLCRKYRACCVAVKNNLYALQAAAEFYLRKFPKLHKIGITGSSGKTTTKEILSAIYSVKYNTITNKGNLNSETGLPLSVFMVRPEHEVGIFELGMNRRGEIREIAKVLLPNAAIITNIGTAHIGILGTQEAIVEEKKEIFSYFTNDCIGFVPECKFTAFLKDIPCGTVYVYSQEHIQGIERIEDAGVAGSKIKYKGEEILFPLPGKYNVQNAVACIALAEKENFSPAEIKRGLESVRALFGRSQIINGFITCFMDCYNANPDSMREAVEFCNSVKVDGLKHYVLASMLELGDASFESHLDIIKRALSSNADIIYFFGDDIAGVSEMCENENKKVFRFKTSEFEALKTALKQNMRKGDFVLLKGSRGLALERLEEVVKGGGLYE